MLSTRNTIVTATQVSLIQLDNYGPWTVTPTPRREPDLQALQAGLYADLAEQIGTRSGYVFYTRFDNIIAVTNGIDREAHRELQRSIRNRYPVTASIGIGHGKTPRKALQDATATVQDAGSAQDEARTEALRGELLPPDSQSETALQIAHFDVVDVTGTYTDQVDAFQTHIEVDRTYGALMRQLYQQHDSLAFFVGGDNIIAVCAGLTETEFQDAIAHVKGQTGVELQVGVGTGSTAVDAGLAAKHSLERCRDTGSRIEGAPQATLGD